MAGQMMPTLISSRETEGLRSENEELRRGRDRADRSNFHTTGPGPRVANGFVSASALESLPEDEEAQFGDFGAARQNGTQNGGAGIDDVLASLQGKRRRTEGPRLYVLVSVHYIDFSPDIAERLSFIPPTQRFATPLRAFTPRVSIVPHTSSRLTMRPALDNQNPFQHEVQEPSTRPLSAMPFGSHGVSSANPPRTNLE
jgi:hypothetical protein